MKRAIELFLILMVIGQIALFSQVQKQSRDIYMQDSIVLKQDIKDFSMKMFLKQHRY